jgi:hypothetical protein
VVRLHSFVQLLKKFYCLRNIIFQVIVVSRHSLLIHLIVSISFLCPTWYTYVYSVIHIITPSASTCFGHYNVRLQEVLIVLCNIWSTFPYWLLYISCCTRWLHYSYTILFWCFCNGIFFLLVPHCISLYFSDRASWYHQPVRKRRPDVA